MRSETLWGSICSGRERNWEGRILYWGRTIVEIGVGFRWSPCCLNRQFFLHGDLILSRSFFPQRAQWRVGWGEGPEWQPEDLDSSWKVDDLPVPQPSRMSA